jgi:hypothetical protein
LASSSNITFESDSILTKTTIAASYPPHQGYTRRPKANLELNKHHWTHGYSQERPTTSHREAYTSFSNVGSRSPIKMDLYKSSLPLDSISTTEDYVSTSSRTFIPMLPSRITAIRRPNTTPGGSRYGKIYTSPKIDLKASSICLGNE